MYPLQQHLMQKQWPYKAGKRTYLSFKNRNWTLLNNLWYVSCRPFSSIIRDILIYIYIYCLHVYLCFSVKPFCFLLLKSINVLPKSSIRRYDNYFWSGWRWRNFIIYHRCSYKMEFLTVLGVCCIPGAGWWVYFFQPWLLNNFPI